MEFSSSSFIFVLLAIFFVSSSLSGHVPTYSPRSGAAAVTHNTHVYLTGGKYTKPLSQCHDCDEYDVVLDSLIAFDTDSNAYQSRMDFEQRNLASMSCPRVHHTAVFRNKQIYVFGGAEGNDNIEVYSTKNDVWYNAKVLDDEYSWTPLGERPSPRFGHGAAVDGELMFIFGGIEYSSGNALNDMWTYNFVSHTWTNWGDFFAGKFIPQPRAGFSLTPYVDEDTQHLRFVLFGGFDSGSPKKFYNDLWTFDTTTFSWQLVTPINSPLPRAFHVADVIEGKYLFIHGGVAPNDALNGTESYFDDAWTYDLTGKRHTFADHTDGTAHYYNSEQVNFDQHTVTTPPHPDLHVGSVKFDFWMKYEFPAHLSRPSERAGHVLVNIGQTKALIFSGANAGRETLADSWLFSYQNWWVAEWEQKACFPGYYFPYCVLDCSGANWCHGHGTCLGNNTCCCDAGWQGETCDYNVCEDYRGFDTDLLNEILLPKSLEATYLKLDIIAQKLENVRELLPHIKKHTVGMKDIANETYHFYTDCLVDNLCPVTECFEHIVGCDEPCGSETFCLVNDHCVNNECVNGSWRDCSEEFKDNKCVNSWCDEEYGCMHSTVNCDDGIACTKDYCDPSSGCKHEDITCDDNDCCTLDNCDTTTGECVHEDKCADGSPCTIDKCNDQCKWGTCEYKLDTCCHSSVGQYGSLEVPAGATKRPLGDPLTLDAYQLVPYVHNNNEAYAYFWLNECECELIYHVFYSPYPGLVETAAHIHGTASTEEQAGAVYCLPLGPEKLGKWNYCKDGVPAQSILDEEFYIQLYFNTGNVRTQIRFLTQDHFDQRSIEDSFRG